MTLSRPVPARAKTAAPGIMPRAVATKNVDSETPAKAGTRLTKKNGKTGTSRRNRR
jgi:hypothetical protein